MVRSMLRKEQEDNFEFLPSTPWRQKKLLSEEFKSLGFYISNHPLNEYEQIFKHFKMVLDTVFPQMIAQMRS